METFAELELWAMPIIDLTLTILCFSFIRGSGGVFLALGFFATMFASVSWPVADLLYTESNDSIYEIAGHVNFVAYLIAAGLFTSGIVILGGLTRLAPQLGSATVLAHATTANPYQTPLADMSSDQANTDQTSTDQRFGSVLLYILPLSLGTILLVIGMMMQSDYSTRDIGVILMLPAGFAMLFAFIYFLVVLHRLWKFTIEQSNQHGLVPSIATPGKAVGFLFIPLYGYYWVFIAYGKLARDVNALARQKGVAPSASEGLGITIAILTVLGIIPFVGYLASFIAGFILLPIYFSGLFKLCLRLKNADTGR